MATFYNADYYKKQKKLAFSHPENQLIAHVGKFPSHNTLPQRTNI